MTAATPIRTVAVLGLGRMGRPIAVNLVAAGFAVRTWNRSGGAVDGAVACATIAACMACRRADSFRPTHASATSAMPKNAGMSAVTLVRPVPT